MPHCTKSNIVAMNKSERLLEDFQQRIKAMRRI